MNGGGGKRDRERKREREARGERRRGVAGGGRYCEIVRDVEGEKKWEGEKMSERGEKKGQEWRTHARERRRERERKRAGVGGETNGAKEKNVEKKER